MSKTLYLLTFLLFLFSGSEVISQEFGLQIDKQNGREAKVYKENKRIKVWTEDGNVYSGKWTVKDSEHISIKGQTIALSSIKVIKRKAFIITIAKVALLSYGLAQLGSAIFIVDGIGAGISAIAGLSATTVSLFLFDIPELFTGSKNSKSYDFKIIPLEE